MVHGRNRVGITYIFIIFTCITFILDKKEEENSFGEGAGGGLGVLRQLKKPFYFYFFELVNMFVLSGHVLSPWSQFSLFYPFFLF